MAITDRNRKILWGRSGNRCAYCRRELVEDGTDLSNESVVGDEAHIIGEKPTAARGEFGVGRDDLDEYANLMLLCKVHHKLVDDQPETFTVERLHGMKDSHERWVRETLGSVKKPRHWVMPYGFNPGFVGRETVLTEMHAALQGSGDAPQSLALVQAIHGLGGVGKTQLAIRYAHAHGEEYDGVFWVQADSPARLASDFAAIYERVGLPTAEGGDDTSRQVRAVREWLESPESGAWLLIFDNADEPDVIRDYLPTRRRGHVLITSRLGRWERANHSIEVRAMDRADSVKLLLQRSGQQDAAAATLLAETLGDLPLALAQAGGYLADSGMPITDYLELFRQRRAELLRRGPCPDGYQLTVFATLDLAMSRIASRDAEELLGVLACLAPERVTRELVGSIQRDPLRAADALTALRRHSLVRFDANTVEVHRLVRAVCWDRMDAASQERRAARAVLVLLVRFPEDPDDVATWPDCKALYPHAVEAGGLGERLRILPRETAELLDRAGAFAARRGRRDEALDLMRRAVTILCGLYGEDHPRIGPTALRIVRLMQERGELDKARAFYLQALDSLPPDAPYVPGILDSMGKVAQQEGKLEEAQEWIARALAVKQSPLGHGAQCLSNTLMNLGDLALEGGDASKARDYHERALQAVETDLGLDDVGVAEPLINLSVLTFAEGRIDEARGQIERAMRVLVKAHGFDHPCVARAAYMLGLVAAEQGDFGPARCSFQLAVEIRETLDEADTSPVADALCQLATLHSTDQLETARAMLLRARAIYEKTHGGECPKIEAVDRVLRTVEELGKKKA